MTTPSRFTAAGKPRYAKAARVAVATVGLALLATACGTSSSSQGSVSSTPTPAASGPVFSDPVVSTTTVLHPGASCLGGTDPGSPDSALGAGIDAAGPNGGPAAGNAPGGVPWEQVGTLQVPQNTVKFTQIAQVPNIVAGQQVADANGDVTHLGLLHDQVTHSVTRPERPVWS